MRLPALPRCLGGGFAGGGMGRVRPRCRRGGGRSLRKVMVWISPGIPHRMGSCERWVQHGLLNIPGLNPVLRVYQSTSAS